MESQWTAELTQCTTCHKAQECRDRTLIKKTLSTLTHELNTTDDAKGGAMGTIIVSCRRSG